jgi:hypothetical protein
MSAKYSNLTTTLTISLWHISYRHRARDYRNFVNKRRLKQSIGRWRTSVSVSVDKSNETLTRQTRYLMHALLCPTFHGWLFCKGLNHPKNLYSGCRTLTIWVSQKFTDETGADAKEVRLRNFTSPGMINRLLFIDQNDKI